MRRRSTTPKTAAKRVAEMRRERDEVEGNPDKYSAATSPTGTSCPEDGCGLPQWSCPSGITCDNGHGGVNEGEPVDPPAAPVPRRSRLAASLDLNAKIGALKTPLDGVVERLFEINFDVEYGRLEAKLSVGGVNTASAAALNTALDESEENARAAHLLFVNAEYQREAFEIDAEILMADLRAQAVARLSGEKGAGTRTKQITDADVRSMIASIAPDEWRSLALRRKRLELTVEHLKRLADLWKNRCGTNETLVRTRR